MDWRDRFCYGMFQDAQVRHVWERKPSYLVWTLCYTKHTFAAPVMEEIEKYVAKGPNGRGLTPILVQRFNERSGVPW